MLKYSGKLYLSRRRVGHVFAVKIKVSNKSFPKNINNTHTFQGNDDIEDEPEALSMAWPNTNKKRLTYLLVAPILFPLWLTLPDTKTPRGKKFYPVTFIGSILWIAAYSYLMVWWANVAGDTAKIPPEVNCQCNGWLYQ